MARILVAYFSEFGHVEQLATAVAYGARSVSGAMVDVRRVPSFAEDLPEQSTQETEIVTPMDLANYDGIVLGCPVRFGNPCAEMLHFLDLTAPLWAEGRLVGVVGAAFTAGSSQHGTQEATLQALHRYMLCQGMIILGIPGMEPALQGTAEISGGSVYGPFTISAADNQRQPSDNEFDLCELLGRRVASLAVRVYGEEGETPPEQPSRGTSQT